LLAFPALGDHCLDVELYNPEGARRGVAFAVERQRGRIAPGASRWVRIRRSALISRTRPGDPPLMIGEAGYVACDAALPS
nr:hypothetical protein [Actinomycetota bacterium]